MRTLSSRIQSPKDGVRIRISDALVSYAFCLSFCYGSFCRVIQAHPGFQGLNSAEKKSAHLNWVEMLAGKKQYEGTVVIGWYFVNKEPETTNGHSQ